MKGFIGKLLLLSCSALLLPFSVSADYVAYAVVDKKEKPLPETIDSIEAKELVNVKWGKYTGSKSRVGVMSVQNDSKTSTVHVTGYGGRATYKSGGNGVPVDGIDSIVTDIMHRTGRFRILERTTLNKLIKEQDLGASGRISKPSAAKVGKILGAEYLIQAVVNQYEPNFEGNNIGLGGITGGFLGGLKIGSKKSMVNMTFRLIDAETSEIIFSKQVSAVLSESNLGFGGAGWGSGGALGGFMNSYSKTPIGQAVIAAINIGVYELVKQIGAKPATGSVIKAAKGKIYLNMGKGRVQSGERLTLLSKGESLIDPETGLDLGGDDTEIGQIQVSKVKEKFSIARAIGSIKGKVKAGDKVQSNRAPESLQFASNWKPSSSSIFDGDSSDSSSDEENSDDF